MKNLKINEISTDLAIIGGGVAGCIAAIRASELIDRVLVVEKCDTRRSGCATTGVDHIWTYVPEIHGPGASVEDIVRDHTQWAQGFLDQEVAHYVASHSYERILDLERFGIDIRDASGKLRFVKKIHRIPNFLHFAGRDLKVKLTQEMKRRKVHILNRVMALQLLKDQGRVTGLIGISTRQPLLYKIRAAAVILSTGNIYRLYRNPTGVLFNIGFPPHETGDGHAMAFRAGARLQNMEFTSFQTGPKNFQRCGRGSYSPGGKIVNARGYSIREKPFPMINTTETHMDKSVEEEDAFLREIEEGRGPLYMDCSSCSEEDVAYIRWALRNEGNTAFLDYLDREGFDFRKQRLEFTVYEPKSGSGKSGLSIFKDTSTSLPGFFAAGDVIGVLPRGVMPGALTLGWKAAETAARFSKENGAELSARGEEELEELEEVKGRLSRLISKSSGALWPEAQLALQNIMTDYAGLKRSETMLTAGLSCLKSLRIRAREELRARNSHDLYRCLEVLNLIDISEMILASALEREETRFYPEHYRIDFPRQDDTNWKVFLTIRKEGDRISFQKEKIKNDIY
jgi:succinate dehydrogenase/fumarate reductase flavoprotein subunit